MTLLAIFLPPLYFLLSGNIIRAVVCLILQITLFGWIPAAIWALIHNSGRKADQRQEKLIKAMRE